MSKHRSFTLLLGLCLLLPGSLSAQETLIVGSVKSRTGEPVRGAYVLVQSAGLGTLTNDAGNYRLTVPAAQASGTVTLEAQSIGYSSVSFEIDLTPGTTIRHDFTLTEQAISLQEVVVTGTAGRLERKAQAAGRHEVRALQGIGLREAREPVRQLLL